MTRWGILCVAAILLATQVPTEPASAGGSVNATGASVEVRDGFQDCSQQTTHFCEYNVSNGNDPANATIDAYQRIDFVGVTVDSTAVNRLLGSHVVGRQSVQINGNSTYLPNPLLPMVSEAWTEIDAQRRGRSLLDVEMSRENVSLVYPMIRYNTSEPIGWNWLAFPYPDDGGIGYDRIGPYNAPEGNSTDGYLEQDQRLLCDYPGIDTYCNPVVGETRETFTATAPNVIVGAEFYNASISVREGNVSNATYYWTGSDWVFYPRYDSGNLPRIVFDSTPFIHQNWTFTPPTDQRPMIPPKAAPTRGTTGPQSESEHTVPNWTVAVVAAAAGALLLAAAAVLYSRFTSKNALLASKSRQELLALIDAHPGISPSEAAAKMGCRRNNIMHHARVLEKAAFIKIVATNGRAFFYRSGQEVPPQEIAVAHPVAQAILRRIRDGGPATMQELLAACGDTPQRTCYYHVARLVNAGLLTVETVGESRKIGLPSENSPEAPRSVAPATLTAPAPI